MKEVNRTLTKAQLECLWEHDHVRFRIITKGRRFGLTYGVAHYFIEKMLTNDMYLLWGDVNYDNIRKYVERMFIPILTKTYRLKQGKDFTYNIQAKQLKLGHSICDLRSAENPQTWEGYGYHLIFLNEAGIILQDDEYLYQNAVLPMMMDYPNSKLIAGGVPKGKKGVFWDLWQKAVSGNDPNYKAFSYSSYDNPLMSSGIIRSIENSMDDVSAKQEIYGQFVDNINNPFVYAFSESKHVKPCKFNDKYPVFLSFDFNVDPLTCLVAQEYDGGIYFIKEYRLRNSDIYALCTEIKKDFSYIGGITGDATGTARSALTQGNVNYYYIIEEELRINAHLNRTPGCNESHRNSRALVNSILQKHPKVHFDPSCKYLIEDLKYVEADGNGNINKNKDAHRTHLLDCFRYYLQTYHNKFVKQFR